MIFRQNIKRILRTDWVIVTLIFLIHIGLTFVSRTIALVAIWLWLYLLVHQDGRQKIGLRHPNHWIWWFSSPIIGLVLVNATAIILWLIFGWSEKNMFYDMANAVGNGYRMLQESDFVWAPYALLGFGWLLQSPLLEEPLFRGLMLGSYGNEWGYGKALLIQAIAFAVVHPLNSVSWFASIFVAGIVYGVIMRKSGSIWPAVLAHSAYNFGIIWIAIKYMPEFVF